MGKTDWFIVIAGIFLLLMSQGLILLAKKKLKQWQEQNRDMIKKYQTAQFVLIVLFVIYLVVLIVQKIM